MTELFSLCLEFFKTGLFAVGGGLATIPFLARMPEHWFSMEQLADMIAISESTPGPLGVNMATFVGYTVAGLVGAVLATLSLVLPSFVIMLMIAPVLQRFRDNRFVNAGFSGLRPAVTGLIAAAGYSVLQMAVMREGKPSVAPAVLFAVLLLCAQMKKQLHPIIYIGAAAIAGIALGL